MLQGKRYKVLLTQPGPSQSADGCRRALTGEWTYPGKSEHPLQEYSWSLELFSAFILARGGVVWRDLGRQEGRLENKAEMRLGS